MLGRLHLRPLQTYLLFLWRPHFHSLDAVIPLTRFFKRHLRWWALESRYIEGIPLKVAPPSRFLTTDASLEGWGAHLDPQGAVFSGLWSLQTKQQHINELELRAVWLSLQEALGFLSDCSVQVLSDNSTVVAYINKQGGTRSVALCLLTRQILLWCLEHRVVLSAIHIAGKSNVLADYLSRGSGPVPNEWTLDQTTCNAVLARWGSPWLDLFATRANHRLPLYVSPMQDLHAWGIDALAFSWQRLDAYAFPPFA